MQMLFTGIPQLQSPQDIAYLKRAFSISLTDAEAAELFKKLIDASVESKSTQLNFAFHIMAHPD